MIGETCVAGVDGRLHHGAKLLRPVADARQDRRHEDPAWDPPLVQRGHGLQPAHRMGRAGLGGPPRLLVHGSHRERRGHVGHLRRLHQQVEVPEDQSPLRQDRERIPVVDEGPDDPPHQPVPPRPAGTGRSPSPSRCARPTTTSTPAAAAAPAARSPSPRSSSRSPAPRSCPGRCASAERSSCGSPRHWR